MVDDALLQLNSFEDLIAALQPINASTFACGTANDCMVELKLMKRNISAVLRFTSGSATQAAVEQDPEMEYLVNEIRRECLLINGMISRMTLTRWFSGLNTDRAQEVLSQYMDMAGASCRLCLSLSPNLGNQLSHSF